MFDSLLDEGCHQAIEKEVGLDAGRKRGEGKELPIGVGETLDDVLVANTDELAQFGSVGCTFQPLVAQDKKRIVIAIGRSDMKHTRVFDPPGELPVGGEGLGETGEGSGRTLAVEMEAQTRGLADHDCIEADIAALLCDKRAEFIVASKEESFLLQPSSLLS